MPNSDVECASFRFRVQRLTDSTAQSSTAISHLPSGSPVFNPQRATCNPLRVFTPLPFDLSNLRPFDFSTLYFPCLSVSFRGKTCLASLFANKNAPLALKNSLQAGRLFALIDPIYKGDYFLL